MIDETTISEMELVLKINDAADRLTDLHKTEEELVAGLMDDMQKLRELWLLATSQQGAK